MDQERGPTGDANVSYVRQASFSCCCERESKVLKHQDDKKNPGTEIPNIDLQRGYT